jgi:xanthine dehydrogenase accessory factor
MENGIINRSEADILDEGREWLRAGARVALATVARTWGSSPRQTGALMVLSDRGHFEGSVSGGCIEAELIERMRADFPAGLETIEYSSSTTRSLPCGGRLLLVLEPLAALDDLDGLIAQLRAGQRVVRTIDLTQRCTSWAVADAASATRFSDDVLNVVYEPPWHLLVVGSGELAAWVCRFAALLGYTIEVCDPRPEYREAWSLSEFPVSPEYPDDYIAAHAGNRQTAIVALTHDPKVDDLAMMEALGTGAFYIGALGSSRTTAKRAERLIEHFGMSAEDVARIRGPIGIDLNTRKPQEIALAVLADITAARNRVTISTERLAS